MPATAMDTHLQDGTHSGCYRTIVQEYGTNDIGHHSEILKNINIYYNSPMSYFFSIPQLIIVAVAVILFRVVAITKRK